MGCSQSKGSGGNIPQLPSEPEHVESPNRNVEHNPPETKPYKVEAKPPVPPSTSTDPADQSHHSLDGSVKSFDSQTAKSVNTGISSLGKPETVSGVSTNGISTNGLESGNASMCDTSSVGSYGSFDGSTKRKNLTRSSSSVIGLDSMIENRREGGSLKSNVVHMEVPFGKPIEEVYDGVHTGPVLGSGISGLVRLVTHKATGVKYAVKCLDLGLVDTDEGLAQLREEIFIMCQLDHPNIVRLEEVYESHSEIYLVQELCLGGELFDRLDEQPDYHYTEAECARLIKQMLCAVRYLHSKGIIHRDLKLENFLFSSTAKDSELKMIDFGLSKHFRYGEIMHDAVGTPYTVAPEVIRGSYDERCDIWAIGVISFLLLSGEPPFGGCGGPEPLMAVRANILAGKFEFEPEDVWCLVSGGAKGFIRDLLVTDPKSRPTAKDAQSLPWLREWADRARTEEDNVLNPNVIKALLNFKEFSDMRKLLCEVLSFTLLPDQIQDLRKEFEILDTDGSGEISLAALKQVLVTNAGAGSLGGLTEDEVEDIFNAMRVKKTETRIHWHEFIAAGLSQCKVDDRNLRLAFDRLDNDHKGYVTLDDIMDLLGNDSLHDEEMMRKMWGDSMKAMKSCNEARITYEDFLLLMKGQTRETAADLEEQIALATRTAATKITSEHPSMEGMMSSQSQLVTVHESDLEVDAPHSSVPGHIKCSSADKVLGRSPGLSAVCSDCEGNAVVVPTPIMLESDDRVALDTPLSMDDDDDIVNSPITTRLPPQSLEPISSVNGMMYSDLTSSNPEFPMKLPLFKPNNASRQRSVSMEDVNTNETSVWGEVGGTKCLVPDARRAVTLPENDPTTKENFADQSKSALQVNRELYRAHRQMRHSVLEASKRFEEQQQRHVRDMLLAQHAKNEASNKGLAGLVMRRVEDKTFTSEEVKKLLDESRAQQQKVMEVANKRGGRKVRGRRKKTVSDIGGMMGSLTQDELQKISSEAQEPVNNLSFSGQASPSIPAVIETKAEDEASVQADSTIPTVIAAGAGVPVEGDLRGATVPGEFKKVNDPFGAHGKYGVFS